MTLQERLREDADQYKAKCAALERENAALRDALGNAGMAIKVCRVWVDAYGQTETQQKVRDVLRAIDAAMAQR